jgi:ribosomal protein S18 acetylase RimI-like enzyme
MEKEAMDIARLTEEDLEALARLYEQLLPEESSLEKMRATFQRLKGDPNYIFLGAKQDGRLVGSVLGIICEELFGECRPFMVVEDVVVDKDQRRGGVGSALMRELERRAVQRACNYIMLVTDSARVDARRFYESLGYHPNAYQGFKKYLGNGQHGTGADTE